MRISYFHYELTEFKHNRRVNRWINLFTESAGASDLLPLNRPVKAVWTTHTRKAAVFWGCPLLTRGLFVGEATPWILWKQSGWERVPTCLLLHRRPLKEEFHLMLSLQSYQEVQHSEPDFMTATGCLLQPEDSRGGMHTAKLECAFLICV